MYDPCSPEMLSVLWLYVEALILGLIFGIIANVVNSTKCAFFGEKWTFNRPESPWIVLVVLFLVGSFWFISGLERLFG